jgi:hypothetical protein
MNETSLFPDKITVHEAIKQKAGAQEDNYPCHSNGQLARHRGSEIVGPDAVEPV